MDDPHFPEQETLLSQESLQGNQLYSYNSLIHDIPKIDILRENTIFHREDHIEVREDQIYSMDMGKRISSTLYSPADFVRLFGDKARQVFRCLKREGYVESVMGRIRIRSRFRICSPEEFHLSGAPGWESRVYNALQSLLLKSYPISADEKIESPVVDLLFSRKFKRIPSMRNSSKDYLFRMGNSLISVDFTQPPSSELLELVRLRLELVYEENMVNFFQIVSSYSADETLWRQKKDKTAVFVEALAGLLGNTWKLFDLEECRIRISGGTAFYRFCNGSLHYAVDSDGHSIFRWAQNLPFPEKIEDQHREYRIQSMQVVINKENFEPVIMDFYMKSRSLHNLNPRQNHLHHKFILLLIENMAKIIEQAIPVLKAEETEHRLKWKTFLDRSRIRSMSWGEDLFRIMVDAVGILKVFLKIDKVFFYTPDQEYCKMLEIYRDGHPSIGMNFRMLDEKPERDEILQQNMIPVRLLEAIDEELTLYICMPRQSEGEDLTSYLEGNMLISSMVKTARGLGLVLEQEDIYPLILSSLNSNAMLTMTKILEQWPREKQTLDPTILYSRMAQFTERILSKLSLFFDVVQAMDNNIEAGITNMRGSRDRLTGLYNRQKFNQRLEQWYLDETPFGLMFIDMDTFKIYNDSISHSFGDQLLIGLAERILKETRKYNGNAHPGRFGGDEFCFGLSGLSLDEFNEAACNLFRTISDEPVQVQFYFEERRLKTPWEVNAISFLHRLLRPDVGGIRGAASEFVEPHNATPKERLLEIYSYYIREKDQKEAGLIQSLSTESILDEQAIEDISLFLEDVILGKIERNRMFRNLSHLFRETLSCFLQGQLKDHSTLQIRSDIEKILAGRSVTLDLHFKISAGLAHTGEDRLRSVSALFKAADSRAYVAKHNGRNGLFGLDNIRLL